MQFRILASFVLTLLSSSALSSSSDVGDAHALFIAQLTAELQAAPAPVRNDLKRSDERLREFIAGRLHDERVASAARLRGLDSRPEVRSAIGSFTREALARAAILEFEKGEREKLPSLDALAQQFYLANKGEYEMPEAIRVAHILVAVDVEKLTETEIAERRERAQSLLARIRAGEDFATLARENSEDKGSASTGGELPRPAQKGTLVPPFEKAAWALKPGETSEVVRTRFGYHVIRLLAVLPKSSRSFEEVRSQILQKIETDLLSPRRAAFVDSFRDTSLEAEAVELLPVMRSVLNGDGVGAGETSSSHH